MKPTRILSAAVVALSLLAFTPMAEAQISEVSANQQLIDSYALTLENVRKVAVLDELLKGSKLADKKIEESAAEEPLPKQWALIEKADTEGLLKKAGISAKDYLMTVMVSVQAAADVMTNAKPRTATNKANIELFRQHRDEIEKMMSK